MTAVCQTSRVPRRRYEIAARSLSPAATIGSAWSSPSQPHNCSSIRSSHASRGISRELGTRDRRLVLLMPEPGRDAARGEAYLGGGQVDDVLLAFDSTRDAFLGSCRGWRLVRRAAARSGRSTTPSAAAMMSNLDSPSIRWSARTHPLTTPAATARRRFRSFPPAEVRPEWYAPRHPSPLLSPRFVSFWCAAL